MAWAPKYWNSKLRNSFWSSFGITEAWIWAVTAHQSQTNTFWSMNQLYDRLKMCFVWLRLSSVYFLLFLLFGLLWHRMLNIEHLASDTEYFRFPMQVFRQQKCIRFNDEAWISCLFNILRECSNTTNDLNENLKFKVKIEALFFRGYILNLIRGSGTNEHTFPEWTISKPSCLHSCERTTKTNLFFCKNFCVTSGPK